ncbi:MAG: tripartite tricarboxylate transporter substrate binding protein [Burkholderiaceae bacterium]|jgi:tripartite-type tricarboxylate transporter receptor subunit TctC|uniref:Tripartite tricarboxylate transporter substrate binding protein n=1 Tax=Cupriavidus metallidurans TaxID=119219 RepID=A0A482J1J9_9BURK|nr:MULTISPECIES: tripartite tricarboxylate transporter substrate binding protein [Cupriavidus]KWR80903.1 ABC transporter substrate-binding protein [Cupriavidus sp. SHE]PCH55808.1 MAG: tripartite tricarboxylate transporter substrate binding protein [Burkholderiaceae bacterium]QBP14006.1 tripartite tricarboxylate transporter substrate binding protein [Cupriavidus metallidurans]QWC91786.1 tripartite tricarboxylate transporter substrate binding protein [Cupriavidus metallidurans]
MRLTCKLLGACALMLAFAGTTVHAQDSYPSKPIRFIVPFAPGGVTDLTARTFAKYMGDALKQPLVTENKAGAGATIGANFVAHAAPDGYTMLLGTNVTHAISPRLIAATPYDPLKDFQTVAIFGLNGNVLLVSNSFPAKTFAEFLAYVKARPGRVNYASGSVGSSAHLAAELLKQDVKGLDYTHVPYGGPSEAMSALMGGHVDFLFANIGAAVTQIQSGKVRALAVTTAKRAPQLPDVPTVAESGVPGFEVVGWMAAFVPKGTPAPTIARLNQVINQAQKNPDLRKTLDAAALIPIVESPEQSSRFVQEEYEKWGRVIQAANIPPQ